MMEQLATEGLGFGIWGLAFVSLFMLIFLMIPLITLAIIIWKLRNIGRANMEELEGQFEDVFREHQEESKKFISNINELLSLWIEREKEKDKK